MPSVVIATNPEDSTSFLVEQALHLKGAQTALVHFSDFPSRTTSSLHLGGRLEDDWLQLFELASGERPPLPETIWWRRPGRPVIPDDVHPEDREFVRQETAKFVRGLWHYLPETVTNVNSPAKAIAADHKPHQLRLARAAGFTTPPTLFSNNPAEIRSAIQRWGGKAIYKAYCGERNFWLDHDRKRILALFTTAIDEQCLPDDETLRLTPGIFQPLLAKAYELRVTVFGSTVFAAKVHSQERKQSEVDWRNGQLALRYESTSLAPALEKLCCRLLRRLGLLMGCFDFVVTPQNDVVFLEVNEGGQFLWLEAATGAPLLDAFSDFLIDPRASFRWKSGVHTMTLEDVQIAANEAMIQARRKHLVPEPLALFEMPPGREGEANAEHSVKKVE